MAMMVRRYHGDVQGTSTSAKAFHLRRLETLLGGDQTETSQLCRAYSSPPTLRRSDRRDCNGAHLRSVDS
eukprot:scaffold245_cov256-Pinguiococcus_pyrenoidosus.AAC.47